MQREQGLEIVREPVRLVAEAKPQLAALRKPALVAAHLLAEVAAALSEELLPVDPGYRDRRARLALENSRAEGCCPALLRRHLLTEEQVTATLGEKAAQRRGRRWTIVRRTNRGQAIAGTVAEQPGGPRSALAMLDQRQQGADRAVRPPAGAQQEGRIGAELPPPCGGPLVRGKRVSARNGERVPLVACVLEPRQSLDSKLSR